MKVRLILSKYFSEYYINKFEEAYFHKIGFSNKRNACLNIYLIHTTAIYKLDMERLQNTLTLNLFQALDLNIFLLHARCIEGMKVI